MLEKLSALGNMLRRFFLRVAHAIRWLLALCLVALFTFSSLSWLTVRGMREVLDSRAFWVAWVQDMHVAEKLQAALHVAVGALREAAPTAGNSPALSTRVADEALGEVESELNRHLDERLGKTIDALVGYLSARDSAPLELDLGLEDAMATAAERAAGSAAHRLCPTAASHLPDALEGAAAARCDESAAKLASVTSHRLAGWLKGSSAMSLVHGALWGSISGVTQVRSAALALRAGIHVLGLTALGCFVVFLLVAWRLRTIATLLSTTLFASAALLAPFVGLAEWFTTWAFGPTAGAIAASAAGLHPIGVGVHLLLASGGVVLLALRLIGPRLRTKFWATYHAHANESVRALAVRVQCAPAGLREPEYVLRVLLVR
jgi:hypothetical protein